MGSSNSRLISYDDAQEVRRPPCWGHGCRAGSRRHPALGSQRAGELASAAPASAFHVLQRLGVAPAYGRNSLRYTEGSDVLMVCLRCVLSRCSTRRSATSSDGPGSSLCASPGRRSLTGPASRMCRSTEATSTAHCWVGASRRRWRYVASAVRGVLTYYAIDCDRE